MKRTGHLFEQIIAPEALYGGYLDARKNKRSCRSVYQFERHLGAELAALHAELRDGTYRPHTYHHFWVYEPKPRSISAPAFRDRVVQHALYRVVRPLADRRFIAQSFACRPGLGTHAAADYVQHAMQQAPRDSYYLQLDIKRYYYSIRHDLLSQQISAIIKDARALELWMLFADTGLGDAGIGLPIGCLMSQLNGLIHLNTMDHFIKRELQAKHYARYVDDFVLIGLSRERALECRVLIADYLDRNLGLQLSKSTIARVSKGINFCGYRTWRHRRYIRKHALYTYRRAIHAGNYESAVSSLGHARKTASLRHMLSLTGARHAENHPLPQAIRRLHDLYPAHS